MNASTPASNSTPQTDCLEKACKKHLICDIQLETLSGDMEFARARLLKIDQHCVYVDRPVHEGVPLELTSEMTATVYFFMDGGRFVFRSRVTSDCQVELSTRLTVPGFALSKPEHVQRQERRTDCRASLAHCEEVIADFLQLDDVDKPHSFSAQLMNISAGGIAAVVVGPSEPALYIGDIYQISFQLPSVKTRFQFRTLLRHIRTLDKGLYIVGMKYLPEVNAAEMRYQIRQISQFVSKQIRRN